MEKNRKEEGELDRISLTGYIIKSLVRQGQLIIEEIFSRIITFHFTRCSSFHSSDTPSIYNTPKQRIAANQNPLASSTITPPPPYDALKNLFYFSKNICDNRTIIPKKKNNKVTKSISFFELTRSLTRTRAHVGSQNIYIYIHTNTYICIQSHEIRNLETLTKKKKNRKKGQCIEGNIYIYIH